MAFNITAILDLPARQPPLGVVATFTEDAALTRSSSINAIVCFVISMLAFSMCIYTKLVVLRKFLLEDYILVLSQCFLVLLMAAESNVLAHGLYHMWDLRVKYMSFYLYWGHIGEVAYILCTVLLKLVILRQFMRLFTPLRRGLMYWTYQVLFWANIGWGIGSTTTLIFQCVPMRKIWDPLLFVSDRGHCINLMVAFIFSPTLFTVQDILLLILPQYSIWKLNLSTPKKVQVSAIFGFGILACVASAIRLYYSVRLFQSNDQFVMIEHMTSWSDIEIMCGLIVVFLPISPRFLQHIKTSRLAVSTRMALGWSQKSRIPSDPLQLTGTTKNSPYDSSLSKLETICSSDSLERYFSEKPEVRFPSIALPPGVIIRTREWDVESQPEHWVEG